MTVSELEARMTLDELLEWVEYDNLHISESWYQHAALMTKIDAAFGVKRLDPRKYLPPVKKPWRSKKDIMRSLINSALGVS